MQSITPRKLLLLVQALPLSLATTQGIEFSFFSCRYLDVSVPYVPLTYTTLLMYGLVSFFPNQSFLIRISVNIMDICSSSQLFAAYHVLHRLLVPRHSPCALSSLTLSFITTFLVNRLILKLLLVFLVYLIFHLYIFQCACQENKVLYFLVVELRRVELLTSCLQGRRSSQLSYSPI